MKASRPRCVRCGKVIPKERIAKAIARGHEPTFDRYACKNAYHQAARRQRAKAERMNAQ